MTVEITGQDCAPGDQPEGKASVASALRGYLLGFALAAALSVGSFLAIGSGFIYGPGIPVALVVLALAQMGVHLVFFLHITTGPDSTNNVLALAFGMLIVGLLILGSLWIMSNLNHNMMPMDEIILRQR